MFEVEAVSQYQCKIGYGINIKTNGSACHYTTTSGTTSNLFKNVTVCASDIPEQTLLHNFEPWKDDQIQYFTLKHIEGVEVKSFALESDKTWNNLAKDKMEILNRELCERNLKASIGCDSLANLTLETSYIVKKSRRLFVPIYSTTYEYKNSTYRFIINGSTSKVVGQRPYSTSKLASISVTGIGAAIGLITSRMNQ